MDAASLTSAAMVAAGVGLLTVAFLDGVITTLAIPEVGGPLTRLLSSTLWRGVRHITSRSQSALLRAAGPVVTMTVVAAWVLCAWLGWTLVFAAVPGAVVEAGTGAPASFASTFYFAATTIVTTGIGDFQPSADVWRVLAGMASVSGLALVTLGITYLIPVTTAAVDRMTFAQRLRTLGDSPTGLVLQHWDGRGFGPLVARSETFVDGLVRLRTENLAYPVLHFFHGGDPDRALALRVAVLDEALTIICHGVAEDARPPARELLPLRQAVDALLHTVVTQAFVRPRDEVPPAPSLDDLEAAGASDPHERRA